MKLIPSPALVKQSLASHSWLGLAVGALMYLVCLSGTLAVFYHEFERWEQPEVDEYQDYDPAVMQSGYEAALARNDEDTHHIFMLMPTDEMPRARVATDTQSWFINRDGTLGEPVSHGWKDLLVNLHLYLHLPTGFGMIVVSILGALLCSLIVSGFMAHPRIIKDAFSLRLKGSRHLEQADIHNRLSVWGAPFHLMIAITGAFFGLAAIMSSVFSNAFYDGDQQVVMETIYGEEPALDQPIEPMPVGNILEVMPSIDPGATPFYVTLEDVGEPEQYAIVGTRHHDRLIYAEQHRFDNQGEYLDKVGFSDGEPGRQAIFSIYRIHFGHFGGFYVKLVYAVLGLALTVVSVTGINVWLARRKTRDSLNHFWAGLVWGTPLALAITAVTQVLLGWSSTALFWLLLVAGMAMALRVNDESRSKSYLLLGTAVTLVLLVAGYGFKFGSAALSPASLGINAVLLVAALVLALLGRRAWRPERQAEPLSV